MRKIIYLSILSIFGLLSCYDDNGTETNAITENKVTSFDDYFKFLKTETDGSVLVQSFSTPLSDESFSVSSSIRGNKVPLALKVGKKTISFTNFHYSKVANKSFSNDANFEDMSEIFGSTFKVKLSPNQVKMKKISNKSSSEVLLESVYIPKIVKVVEYSGLQNNKIVAGSEITWNADNQNENGVVIGFEYKPHAQLEKIIVDQKSDILLKGTTIEDNGSYTITAQDIEEFPQNAMITFYVLRAGYGISTNDSGEDYSLAGFTVKRTDLQIQK